MEEVLTRDISSIVFILVILFSLLMFIAPLGIWNRLIKIHRDQLSHAKKIEKYNARIVEELKQLRVTMQSIVTEAEDESDA